LIPIPIPIPENRALSLSIRDLHVCQWRLVYRLCSLKMN
jgi:hypothetical protein